MTVVGRRRRAIKVGCRGNIKDYGDGRIAATFGISREPPFVWLGIPKFDNLITSTLLIIE